MNDVESENARLKGWSRHRNGRLGLRELDMEEYAFYVNVGEGMKAVMRGLAAANGGPQHNSLL